MSDAWASRNRAYHNRVADEYETGVRPEWLPSAVFAFKARVAETIGLLPKAAAILDIGGGTSAELASIGFERVFVLDISERMLAKALAEAPHVVPCLGDATVLPFADGSFDCVTVRGTLHHLFQPERALFEVFRVLRPGGIFLAVEPNASSFLIRDQEGEPVEGRIERPLDLDQFRRSLIDTGFATAFCETYLHFQTARFLHERGLSPGAANEIMIAMNPLFAAHGQGEIFVAAARKTPVPFPEGAYLARHADVAAAVASGGIASGEAHWRLYGQREGRVLGI